MKTTITGRLCACVVITSALAVSAWANSPPTVTNITAAQRTDGSKLVDIGYDLADADGDPCTVSVLVSDDGGTTWDVPAVSLIGDVGAAYFPHSRAEEPRLLVDRQSAPCGQRRNTRQKSFRLLRLQEVNKEFTK